MHAALTKMGFRLHVARQEDPKELARAVRHMRHLLGQTKKAVEAVLHGIPHRHVIGQVCRSFWMLNNEGDTTCKKPMAFAVSCPC